MEQALIGLRLSPEKMEQALIELRLGSTLVKRFNEKIYWTVWCTGMRGPSNVEEQPFGYGITNGNRGSLRNLSGILMTLDRMTLKRGQRWSMRANVYSLVKPEIYDRTNDL